VFLDRDGLTERRGSEWAGDRPWTVILFDPFDVWGLSMGLDEKTRLWDMSDEDLARLRAHKKKNKEMFSLGQLTLSIFGAQQDILGNMSPASKRAQNHKRRR
jgi:hypothetical protein